MHVLAKQEMPVVNKKPFDKKHYLIKVLSLIFLIL